MIVSKDHHVVRVGIDPVIGYHVIESQSTTPVSELLTEGLRYGLLQRKVHKHHATISPRREYSGTRHPRLSHYRNIRILLSHTPHPPCHTLSISVWISVNTQSRQSCRLNPPYSHLRHILSEQSVTHIEVGHSDVKPTLHSALLVIVGGVNISNYAWPVISRLGLPLPAVYPLGTGAVRQPIVTCAAMVQHNVHHKLYAPLRKA